MRAWALVAILASPNAFSQTVVDDLGAMRDALAQACPSVAPSTVATSTSLDEVAQQYAQGVKLDAAIANIGYRASSVLALTLTGKASRAEHMQQRAAQELRWQCDELRNEPPDAIGLFRDGQRLTAILARSRPEPNIANAAQVRDVILAYVNEARSRGRTCGEHRFRAAEPVTLSDTLARAALLHAVQMADSGSFAHVGVDGSTPADRLTQVGYAWQASGENLALGFHEADEVVRGWLESPGHCANIMDSRFSEMGLAWVTVKGPQPRTYWVQTFASPYKLSRVSERR
jgi:uncharacterized protein YkwD